MAQHRWTRRGFLAQGAAGIAGVGGLTGCVTLGLTGGLLSPAGARAAAEPGTPGGPLRLLCSGPPGSIPDTLARRVAEQLPARPGGLLVDNRPGAAGQIAVAALKNGPADGSVMLLAQGAIATVYPALYPNLAYDPALDLAPVSLAGEMTLALAVGPAVPAAVTDIPGLLAWLQREPARANLGSPGTGTLPHLLTAMLMREAGVAWQHVAYAGGPPAMVDLMGGQIATLVLPEGLLRPQRIAGRLRILATSGAQRSALLPDVPTLAEQGHPALVLREWFGFFMAARVPGPVVEAQSAALRLALAQPALGAAFAESGMVAVASTPAAMAARIGAEQRHWAPLIRQLGVRAE